MSKKVVIVGAGYAGIETALKLYKHRRKNDLDILIIDRNPFHALLTEIHEVAGNRVAEDAVRIPLKQIFANTAVNVKTDCIEAFDFEGNKVRSKENEYPYDYLVLSLGSTPNYFGIEGLQEYGFPLWSIENAITIRDHIERCFCEAETEKDPAQRQRLLTFVVGGAGFTGVEMIGELAQWKKKLCRQYNISPAEVRLIIIDMLNSVLSNLCGKCSVKAHNYMVKKLGIEVMLETAIKKVTTTSVELDGRTIETSTLIWAAGVRSSLDADKTDLEKGPGRRLSVDQYCRTKYTNVFAIGDFGALLDEKGKPYPAMVETALQTGEGVAKNILSELNGKPIEEVKVKLHGVMVSIGNYFAVADLMGVRPGRWISLMMKYLVNVHYLHGILGIKGAWTYLRDEILHRRQHKRFFQRNYTKTVQAWWLVPLRLFLGWTWVWEGMKKIGEGWFNSPKLAAFLGVPNMVTGATPTVEAVTGASVVAGATQAVGSGVVEKLLNIDLGFLGIFLERSAASAPLVFRVKFFLVDWIVNGWVLATPFWSMFFQILIVILELIVGLAIFSGTFTFMASIVSIGLLMMFVTTTGMYDTTWWMLFAAIAMAAGAGRAFGLDHYVMPYLARVWDATKKNGRLILTFGKFKKKK
ncbi:MAG: NAD(P)/FAD-dependent oxidoreductase [Christensenellales bacterium]